MTCQPRVKQVSAAPRFVQRASSLGARAAPLRSQHAQRDAHPWRAASPRAEVIEAPPRKPVVRSRSGLGTPQTSRTVVTSPSHGSHPGKPAVSLQSSPRTNAVFVEEQSILPLGSDQEVRISGTNFQIFEPLGHGSFGAVWRAIGDGVGEVAVKEILCSSDAELCRASFEVRLLQLLNHSVPSSDGISSGVVHRIPALVASDVDRMGEGWRLRLAMSRVPGAPLEEFLSAWRRNGVSMESKKQFESACRFVGEMLVQLAPTLEQFSSQVYHRDVTPRNILVELPESEAQEPRFGIVDFGLAVNSTQWRSNPSSSDLGGDGHYWPVSAWYVFGYGTESLKERPHLYEEYRTCLDIHGLGISSLRVLMEMLPCLCDDRVYEVAEDEASRKALSKLRALYKVWFRYWGDARRFWQPVFDSFKYGGDFDALKAAYVRAGVHRIMSADLCALRAAIIQARLACLDVPTELGLCGMSALFDALLLMVRPGRERAELTPWCSSRDATCFESSASTQVCQVNQETLIKNSESQETLPPMNDAQYRGRSPKKTAKHDLRHASPSTETPGSLSSSSSVPSESSAPTEFMGSPVCPRRTL